MISLTERKGFYKLHKSWDLTPNLDLSLNSLKNVSASQRNEGRDSSQAGEANIYNNILNSAHQRVEVSGFKEEPNRAVPRETKLLPKQGLSERHPMWFQDVSALKLPT